MGSSRNRLLVVPREHGAWGLLLVPFFTGAAVGFWSGGRALPLAPLLLAAVALFWLRTPVENWAGTSALRAQPGEELRRVRITLALLATVAVLALALVFWNSRSWALAWIGAGAAAAFLAQALLKKAWRKARTAAQMIGAAGLTSTAPAAYLVATGHWTTAAWALWIANLMFAINQIHFVHLRIHAAKTTTRAEKLAAGRGFLAGQLVLMLAIGLACGLGPFPWYAALAFVPLLCRGFAWFSQKSAPLAVRVLGWSELRIAIVFALLLVWGVRLGS
ncbi:MAG TPA: YwiC-like family protein [Bryobacteraceae bacterium]|nr:YwiC-like family protein [Bryobacteraceae bacterium]